MQKKRIIAIVLCIAIFAGGCKGRSTFGEVNGTVTPPVATVTPPVLTPPVAGNPSPTPSAFVTPPLEVTTTPTSALEEPPAVTVTPTMTPTKVLTPPAVPTTPVVGNPSPTPSVSVTPPILGTITPTPAVEEPPAVTVTPTMTPAPTKAPTPTPVYEDLLTNGYRRTEDFFGFREIFYPYFFRQATLVTEPGRYHYSYTATGVENLRLSIIGVEDGDIATFLLDLQATHPEAVLTRETPSDYRYTFDENQKRTIGRVYESSDATVPGFIQIELLVPAEALATTLPEIYTRELVVPTKPEQPENEAEETSL